MLGGYNPWFIEELNRRANAMRQDRLEALGAGGCGDFADYRYGVGFFDGLQMTLTLADEIKRELDRG